jgi:hypothetical protein
MHAIYHLWRSIIIHCTAEELDEDEAQSAGGALCRVRTQQAKSSRRSCGGACTTPTTPRSIHAIAGGEDLSHHRCPIEMFSVEEAIAMTYVAKV